MPLLSLGGMRFQQSWKEIEPSQIIRSQQKNLEEILRIAVKHGMHHLETARHYGTSELQLGWGLEKVADSNRILQTKIPPRSDPQEFENELKLSFERLKSKKINLLAIHGINLPEHLEQTLRPCGCLDVVRRWQEQGRVDHVGFSTHAPTDLIVQTIESNEFDYVNLHWYFIRQNNEPALEAAKKFDLGVFIISPTDKGGHLHTPSSKLLHLCSPLHPIVFNDLFCLRDSRVHTLSVGASKPEDLTLHFEALDILPNSEQLIADIEQRLLREEMASLGESWMTTWYQGLPSWEDTPGNINLHVLLWLYNLLISWDMSSFAKDRYSLLGRGGHWFPGSNADCLDAEVNELALKDVLHSSPWKNEIPEILRELRSKVGDSRRDRLWGV